MPDIECYQCHRVFFRKPSKVQENLRLGHRFYCSSECESHAKKVGCQTRCYTCGADTYRSPAQVKRSQSGRLFCSRSCATIYNNRFKVGNNHGNFKPDAASSYRARALDAYGAECKICTYSIRDVLEVHHIDGYRANNEIENLVVLCPTHHKEADLGLLEIDRWIL